MLWTFFKEFPKDSISCSWETHKAVTEQEKMPLIEYNGMYAEDIKLKIQRKTKAGISRHSLNENHAIHRYAHYLMELIKCQVLMFFSNAGNI